jgi:hypothetical protein
VPLQVYSVPWGGRAGCFACGSGCAACVSTCCAYGLTLRAFLSSSLCVHARLLLPSTILFFVIVRTCSFVAPPSSILFVTCTVCLTCGVVRLGDVKPNLQKEKKKNLPLAGDHLALRGCALRDSSASILSRNARIFHYERKAPAEKGPESALSRFRAWPGGSVHGALDEEKSRAHARIFPTFLSSQLFLLFFFLTQRQRAWL